MARPTDYCKEIADDICERLSDGESLKAICSPEEMPTRSTVYRWLGIHDEFSDMYARAREEQAETLADEIIAISDETYADYEKDKDGNLKTNNEAIQRSRLRVDARKWVAAKLKPRKFGDKLQTENTTNHVVTDMTEEQLDHKLQSLLDATSQSE